jgi:2,4-dienoyl-CoA reductase-like NADH-dependent reductase (Old Yellow Enzyme family)/thioredoxin reductase
MLLSTSIKINGVTLKNRMMMAPMATHLANEDGSVTEALRYYYVERAAGGVAMITMESCFVNQSGRGGVRRLGIHRDSLGPGLKSVPDAIHEAGSLVCCELHHGGPQCKSSVIGEMPLCASSSYYQLGVIDPPRAVRRDEIPSLAEDYAHAAVRAKQAGFDVVMLHFGHGYLANSFLCPLTNTRADEYGGSFENRMRFPLEILTGVRKALGPDFPIIVRMNAEDGLRGGIEYPEAVEMAKVFAAQGADCLQVTAGIHLRMEKMVQPMSMPRGLLVEYAAGIKKVVSIPVSTVGRINDPVLAEEILQSGKADIITLGRPLIADPDFPRKAMEGRAEEIRPCIACNQGCNSLLHLGKTITCFGNPRVGREADTPVTPVDKPKNVCIIGGGIAGMQAALTAAQRGHHVSLFEADDHLGGQLLLASKPPHKEEIGNLVQTTERQLASSGVDIHLGKRITIEEIKALNPDAVIVATGSIPFIPPVEGVHNSNVFTAQKVLLQPELVSGTVVSIGAGATGLETAELLASRGCKVTIVEMLPTVALDQEANRRRLGLESLGDYGVRILVNAKVKKIEDHAVTIEWNCEEATLPADYVILSAGVRPQKELMPGLESLNCPVVTVGNCARPGAGIDSLRDGFEAGRTV